MKRVIIVVIGFCIVTLSGPFMFSFAEEEGHEEHSHESAAHGEKGIVESGMVYTCPMHPDIVSDTPGTCPQCGMNLVEKAVESEWDNVSEGTATGSAVGQDVVDVNNENCPVSDEPVSGKNFAEYEGHRYGFCCDMCIRKFNSDPKKYIQ